MPRTAAEILAHADELADRFEQYEPRPEDEVEIPAIGALRSAAIEQAEAQRKLIAAVQTARRSGMSWRSIGALIGTSGEAARQKYRSYAA